MSSSSSSSSTAYAQLSEHKVGRRNVYTASNYAKPPFPSIHTPLPAEFNLIPPPSRSSLSLNRATTYSNPDMRFNPPSTQSSQDVLRSISNHTSKTNYVNPTNSQASNFTESLYKESQQLLQVPEEAKEISKPTLFDLKFADRKKIANLICKLAETQEQLELLQNNHKTLTASLNNQSRVSTKSVSFEGQMCDQKLQETFRQNQLLIAKVAHLEEQNGCLIDERDLFQKKLNRCTKDNQRLKWILRTIQQREEILLTHNNRLKPEPEVVPTETMSSQPFVVNETTQTDNFNYEILTPKETRRVFPQQSGDYHEIELSDPHLVIPSNTAPIIMKILKGDSNLEYPSRQNFVSPVNTKMKRSRDLNLSKENEEDEILKELFFI